MRGEYSYIALAYEYHKTLGMNGQRLFALQYFLVVVKAAQGHQLSILEIDMGSLTELNFHPYHVMAGSYRNVRLC